MSGTDVWDEGLVDLLVVRAQLEYVAQDRYSPALRSRFPRLAKAARIDAGLAL
ncbi:hypothetical protein [Nesterenkonia pannonica]|uniref:hypothetical protein n=1 Tax=Nesterenkonia pannonica TaxID=1548602 RepID=UPI0021649E79|nr:hypothetical protein [Nesterenkonia pannonica]